MTPTPTPSSDPSSSPSPSGPGPAEQATVVMLFLNAVANRQPIPQALAVAVLALTPAYSELLAVKLAQLEHSRPEVVKPPQPALDVLQQAKQQRLSNGVMLAEQLKLATVEQRRQLYLKGLQAGLMPGPQGPTGAQADKALPSATQAELAAQRKLATREDQAARAADLKQGLALRGQL